MPDDARDKDAHTVMWDYNVGLVRVTSLFKSLKHPKVRFQCEPLSVFVTYTFHLDNASKGDDRKFRASGHISQHYWWLYLRSRCVLTQLW